MKTGIGDWGYYFNKLWKHWSKKEISGEITENQMENKIDRYEEMSTQQLKGICKRLGLIKEMGNGETIQNYDSR